MKKMLTTVAALLLAAVLFAQGTIEFYGYNKQTKTTEGEVKVTFLKGFNSISPKLPLREVYQSDSLGIWVAGNKGATGDMTLIMKVYNVPGAMELEYTRLKKDNTIDGVWYYRNIKPKTEGEELGEALDDLSKAIQQAKEEKRLRKEKEAAEKAAKEN